MSMSTLRGPRCAQTGLAPRLRGLQVLHDGTAVVAGSDDGQVCRCCTSCPRTRNVQTHKRSG